MITTGYTRRHGKHIMSTHMRSRMQHDQDVMAMQESSGPHTTLLPLLPLLSLLPSLQLLPLLSLLPVLPLSPLLPVLLLPALQLLSLLCSSNQAAPRPAPRQVPWRASADEHTRRHTHADIEHPWQSHQALKMYPCLLPYSRDVQACMLNASLRYDMEPTLATLH